MKTTEFGPQVRRFIVKSGDRLHYVKLSREQFQKLNECYHLWSRIALRLLHSQELATPWVVGITSSISGEGKTTNSIGISLALAQETGERVALVEANLQSPTMAADFGVDAEPGLMDYLLDKCSLWDICKQTTNSNLTVIPTGTPAETAHTLMIGDLGSQLRRRLAQTVNRLRQQFPYILLDLPPILGNVDAEELLREADGALLVVRAGVTPLDKFREAAQLLENASLLGVIHLGPSASVPRWLSYLTSE